MPVAESYVKLASQDSSSAPFAVSLSEEDHAHALEKAKELIEILFTQQEEKLAYSLSLSPEYFNAMEEDRQLALQVNDRLLRVYKYYHPNDNFSDELDERLGKMEEDLDDYHRMIVDLGSIKF
jgi:hypothetical protein